MKAGTRSKQLNALGLTRSKQLALLLSLGQPLTLQQQQRQRARFFDAGNGTIISVAKLKGARIADAHFTTAPPGKRTAAADQIPPLRYLQNADGGGVYVPVSSAPVFTPAVSAAANEQLLLVNDTTLSEDNRVRAQNVYDHLSRVDELVADLERRNADLTAAAAAHELDSFTPRWVPMTAGGFAPGLRFSYVSANENACYDWFGFPGRFVSALTDFLNANGDLDAMLLFRPENYRRGLDSYLDGTKSVQSGSASSASASSTAAVSSSNSASHAEPVDDDDGDEGSGAILGTSSAVVDFSGDAVYELDAGDDADVDVPPSVGSITTRSTAAAEAASGAGRRLTTAAGVLSSSAASAAAAPTAAAPVASFTATAAASANTRSRPPIPISVRDTNVRAPPRQAVGRARSLETPVDMVSMVRYLLRTCASHGSAATQFAISAATVSRVFVSMVTYMDKFFVNEYLPWTSRRARGIMHMAGIDKNGVDGAYTLRLHVLRIL